MFFYQSRKAPAAEAAELVGQFTPEESVRITHLHKQFQSNPICFKFDINYERLEFARWLVDHGYLSEWSDGHVDVTRGTNTSTDHNNGTEHSRGPDRW